jgi:glycosyltransferase involved in cell wall biosynthesis
VPAADPAALAEAISLLRRDPGWRRRMGEQGRRLALDYLPEAMARRYLDIYREILAE